MSEEVKNEENNSEKKWLWLLLLLLLFIFVVVGIVVFLKDNGTAEAIDNDYNEVKQEQVVKNDEPKEETGISSNEETIICPFGNQFPGKIYKYNKDFNKQLEEITDKIPYNIL